MLYGSKLEAEREVYMELDVPDLGFKRPFYYDVLEGKPFAFSTEEFRVQIQINLLMTFLKSGGQLWALKDYWTQVGIATGHSAAMADFNWSPAHISVSILGFVLGVHHKPNFSVMGKIDMFSMVRTLLVRLSGLLDEKWAQSTQYFRKVR